MPWLADGDISGCTFDTCTLQNSFFAYRPLKSANMVFTILFGLSGLAFLAQSLAGRRWLGFSIAMVTGCVLEVIGYAGRVVAYEKLWSEGPFLTQIVCLTITPAFLAAGIYLCLSQVVTVFGSENSRISPKSYPRIFVVCDFLSLVLQATSGGIASASTHQHTPATKGNNIMIAGLAIQVFTLLIFIFLALDFAIRTMLRTRQLDGAENALDYYHVKLRKSWPFRGFLIALSLSTLCIFTRCVFRVAELSDGWSGHLMKKEHYFIGLENTIIIVAVIVLNVFHPAFCFVRESLNKECKLGLNGLDGGCGIAEGLTVLPAKRAIRKRLRKIIKWRCEWQRCREGKYAFSQNQPKFM
ncbi:parasitic phase-specific protein PSP-1 [Phaeosphaeriaceae sp. PMI808]|nr:parasitic phase-specific protein PSP-1 [Phaeosphaeriaceae sp. PMI808]